MKKNMMAEVQPTTDPIVVYKEVMSKGSEAEHEGSHLLESYGSLILALEKKLS